MAIGSKGNAGITNTAGTGLPLEIKLHLLELKLTGNLGEVDRVVVDWLKSKPGVGNVTALQPDGSQALGSPYNGGGSTWGAWGVAIDGNDQVWISDFAGRSITRLCGARTDTCPPGMKMGDPHFPTRRICRRRHADVDRHCHRSGRRRLGGKQLAGPRQLLRQAAGGKIDLLWRQRIDRLLWHGEAGLGSANRTSARAIEQAADAGSTPGNHTEQRSCDTNKEHFSLGGAAHEAPPE
jgi:hypothetical protein